MGSLAEKLNKKDSCSYTENNLTKIINERININPIAIIMVGSPGSGKSSLKQKFVKNYLGRRMDEFIDCDPDITLKYLKKNYTNKSSDESSQKLDVDCYYNSREINDIIYTYAQKKYLNLILDGTGQDYIWTTGQIENLYHSGYDIYICIVTLTEKIALMRSEKRGKKTGRIVPVTEIVSRYKNVQEAIPFYIKNKRAKEVIVYDNSGDKNNASYNSYKNNVKIRHGYENDFIGVDIKKDNEYAILGEKKYFRKKKTTYKYIKSRTKKTRCKKTRCKKTRCKKYKFVH